MPGLYTYPMNLIKQSCLELMFELKLGFFINL